MCRTCEQTTIAEAADYQLAEMYRDLELALGEQALRRPMTYVERTFGDVLRVRDDMIEVEADVFTAAAQVVEKMAGQLAREAQDLGAQVRGVAELEASYVGELAHVLYEGYQRAMRAGTEQVRDAYQAQRTMGLDEDEPPDPPKLRESPAKTPEEMDEYARTKADADARKIAGTVSSTTREEKLRAINQGRTDDAAYEGIQQNAASAGQSGLVAVARSTSREGIGMGRVRAYDEVRDEVETAVYTAILDNRVCPVCAAMDGQTYPGSKLGKTPNGDCLGAPNCRCYEILIFRREAA